VCPQQAGPVRKRLLEYFWKLCRPQLWLASHPFRRKTRKGWGTEVYSKSQNALKSDVERKMPCFCKMRRWIAISLLLLLGWTLAAPMLAADADSNLPACCRRHGKHHCMMSRMGQHSGSKRGFTSASERCPCCPASACPVHSPIYAPNTSDQFYGDVVFQTVPVPRSATPCRSAFFRGYPKRGPPTPLA